jgi:hypothetical protein
MRKIMYRRLVLSLAGAALLAVPATTQAQAVCVGINTCSLSPSASLTIPKVVRLATTSSLITLTTPDFSTDSLDGQQTTTTYGGISVRSNHDWTLNISSAAASWTYTPAVGASGGARARSDLEFQANCAGGWTALAATAAPVASGTLTNGAAASVCLRTAFPADYTDPRNRPGTYTLALTLTLAAN